MLSRRTQLDPADWEDLLSAFRRRRQGRASLALLAAELSVHLALPAFRYQVEGMVIRLRSIVKHDRPDEFLRDVLAQARALRFLDPAANLVHLSTVSSAALGAALADAVGLEPVVRRALGFSVFLEEGGAPLDLGVELVLSGASPRPAQVAAEVLSDVCRTGSDPTPALVSALRAGAHQGSTSDEVKGVFFNLQLRGLLGSQVEELTYRLVLDGMPRREAYAAAELLASA